MKTLSPLRYPGGKTQMYGLVKEILKKNDMLGQVYVEPFAGGAGLALKLLMNDDVSEIIINEKDPCIHALWYMILNKPITLCDKLLNIEINYSEWLKQKLTYVNYSNRSTAEVAIATLFLNRTNFSGILLGGCIGGEKQINKDKIDCRFNRGELINKILEINKYKHKIRLYCMDGVELADALYEPDNIFINCDPPYIEKGKQLYTHYFTEEDHKRLATVLSITENKWICSYDVNPLAEELYKDYRKDYVDMRYSVAKPEKAKELIVYSNNLVV